MRVIDLKNPFPNGFDPEKDQERADWALTLFQEVYDAIGAGTAYIRYLDGDRKGSIARISFSDKYRAHERPKIVYSQSLWNKELTRKLEHIYFYCTATWDGRRNKVQVSLPAHYEAIEVLLDYDGPTIYEKFDAKAAKEELLKNPDQKDINGNVLSVGDEVLYINARYGSRMTLEEGTVVEFLASVNSKAHTFTTVIKSKTGELSSLQYPESMVYKK